MTDGEVSVSRTEGAGDVGAADSRTSGVAEAGVLRLSPPMPAESGVPASVGEAALEYEGRKLPPGARIEELPNGKKRIHIPAHSALPRTKDKVAIIGFTPSAGAAPWRDPDWEFWGINAWWPHASEAMPLSRFSRWFDVHDMAAVTAERLAKYRTFGIPVYLQREIADMPQSVRFPREELLAWSAERFSLQPDEKNYCTNSISWQIAFALMMGFTTIGVWGVDMAQDSEYRFQRPNVEFWLGIARGMGVEVIVAPTSDLLHATHEYGYGTDNGLRAKLKERMAGLEKQESGLIEQIRQLELARATVNGARQNVEWMIQSWAVADHTSMTPDVAKVAPGAAVGGAQTE